MNSYQIPTIPCLPPCLPRLPWMNLFMLRIQHDWSKYFPTHRLPRSNTLYSLATISFIEQGHLQPQDVADEELRAWKTPKKM